MKLYAVKMYVTVVVAAEDAAEAEAECLLDAAAIVDSENLDAEYVRHIQTLADLPADWDGDCIPYGGPIERQDSLRLATISDFLEGSP